MRNVLMLSVLVPALFVALSASAAEPSTGGKGSVKGKVVGVDGKVAAGAPVRLMHRSEAKPANGKAAEAAPSAAEPHKGHKAAKGAAAPAAKNEAVAETTADAKGEFSFDHVAAGKYVVVSNIKGVGAGREQVTVADAPASVTVKLKARGEGKAKGKATQTSARAQHKHHKAVVS
jgi:hypothetical protein